MRACPRDPPVVSSENEREIFHGRDSFRFFETRAACAAEECRARAEKDER